MMISPIFFAYASRDALSLISMMLIIDCIFIEAIDASRFLSFSADGD